MKTLGWFEIGGLAVLGAGAALYARFALSPLVDRIQIGDTVRIPTGHLSLDDFRADAGTTDDPLSLVADLGPNQEILDRMIAALPLGGGLDIVVTSLQSDAWSRFRGNMPDMAKGKVGPIPVAFVRKNVTHVFRNGKEIT